MGSMEYSVWKPLSGYIKELMRIREELKDTIFLGRYTETMGVKVKGDNFLKYCTHENPQTGKRACVLANYGETVGKAWVVFEGGSGGMVSVYQPLAAKKTAQPPITVTIPPERLVIVIEN